MLLWAHFPPSALSGPNGKRQPLLQAAGLFQHPGFLYVCVVVSMCACLVGRFECVCLYEHYLHLFPGDRARGENKSVHDCAESKQVCLSHCPSSFSLTLQGHYITCCFCSIMSFSFQCVHCAFLFFSVITFNWLYRIIFTLDALHSCLPDVAESLSCKKSHGQFSAWSSCCVLSGA